MSFVDVDPAYLALSRLRRRKFDQCIDMCTDMLEQKIDEQIWWIKCRALTNKSWIDDTEVEEEGVADMLLDERGTVDVPRPGTSMNRPLTHSSSSGMPNQGVRPFTNSGRPLTGFMRPGTGGRPSSGMTIEGALQNRPGTSRPVTSSGRFVRLGTASLAAARGGPFVNFERIDLRKYIDKPALARALCDYALYVEHNARKAVELCALATSRAEFKEWWWKARLGKSYYRLGMLRDAEDQFRSAIREQDMVTTNLELAKIFVRLDQPNTALQVYQRAHEVFAGDVSIILGIARIHDALNDQAMGVQFYKKVLHFDASNVEAIACLAANQFYCDQPELALRYFRRLLHMGCSSAELWNNIGLCCYYAGQYDMCLTCFERALSMADDDNMSDIWYNISQLAVGIGDQGLAYQAAKVAVSIDNSHAESFCSLGVLDLKKGNIEQARSSFMAAQTLAPHSFEPFYNQALLSYKLGEFQDSFEFVKKAIEVYPEHADSLELRKQLMQKFTLM